MIKKSLIVLYISIIAFVSSINAQDVIGTTNGTIQITGVWNDSNLSAKSNDLVVILNYETAEFLLRLDKSTLKTGIDSLDNKLMNLVNDFFMYEGKLGIEYIKTYKHAPEDFEVNGYLNCDPHYENIIGKGHLENISGNIYSCILNMTFDLNLEEINLNIDLPGLSNDVHVEILQTVLKNKY